MPRRLLPLLTVLALAGLVLAGCGANESTSTPTQSAAPSISLAQAEHIWLSKFVPLVEAANGKGEGNLHLNSPGVEQRCEAKEGGYHCIGIEPTEEPGHFIPGHETNCEYVTMTIDRNGHIKEEDAEPIAKFRETFHVEAECHL